MSRQYTWVNADGLVVSGGAASIDSVVRGLIPVNNARYQTMVNNAMSVV